MRFLPLLWASAVFAAPHPLAPLTAAEIRDAVRIFRASGHAPATARFHFLSLQEPPKKAVPRRASIPRQAFTVIYDHAADRLGEAVADLSTGKLAS
jgi:primary-amine oxidase